MLTTTYRPSTVKGYCLIINTNCLNTITGCPANMMNIQTCRKLPLLMFLMSKRFKAEVNIIEHRFCLPEFGFYFY